MGTVLIDFRSISWGSANEDDSNNVWELEGPATDPGSVELENFGSVGDPVVNFPAPATHDLGGQNLNFVFWNATNGTDALPGYPSSDPQRKLNVPNQPPGTVVHATAWYAPPTGPGNGGKPNLRCRSFDIDLNGFRKETPILSATPKAAWAGPNNHSVFTDKAAVTATPKSHLDFPAPMSAQPPGEPPKEFKYWQKVVGAVSIDTSTNVASCPKDSSALALAFFGHSIGHRVVGKDFYAATFDWWAEFWGKKGAEGVGPFGPGGPGDPWGGFVARMFAALPPDQIRARLQREIASLKAMADKLAKK